MSRSQAPLRVVPKVAPPAPLTTPEERLAMLVPALIEAEKVLAEVRVAIAEQGRKLATKRGVVFIRPEALRQEFGGVK